MNRRFAAPDGGGSPAKAEYSKIDTAKVTGINKRGSPILNVGGVPGYNMQTGTPGWIRAAADKAEGQRSDNDGKQGTGPHRMRDAHQAGAPPYGKQAQVDPKRHTQGGDGRQAIKKGR